MRFLARFAEPIFAALRFVAGLMFALHGAQKLFGAFGGTQATSTKMWVAGTIELLGGLLIAVGFLTVFAAFLAAGLMAFAYFLAHAPSGLLPIVNRGELAALYCFLWLYIAARGAGPYSLDGLLARHRAANEPMVLRQGGTRGE